MKKQTIFSISSAVLSAGSLVQHLSDLYKAQIEQLIAILKQKLGTVTAIHSHPYRVGRVNYVKIRVDGELGQFHLLFEISGYTEFPELNGSSMRLHINITDSTDAYWLAKLLQQELCTQTVDNSV